MNDIVTGETAVCIHCRQRIYAVIDPHSGVVDWGSGMFNAAPEDFGCGGSPHTNEEGTGNHNPGPGHTPIGFQTRPTKETK